MASTSGIPKISVADAALDDWTLPEEVITGGNPVARGRFLWQSDDKRLGNGVWTCEPGSFRWDYTWDETIYFIEGEATITDQDGNSVTCRGGDMFFVSAGTRSTWEVTAPMRKVFRLR